MDIKFLKWLFNKKIIENKTLNKHFPAAVSVLAILVVLSLLVWSFVVLVPSFDSAVQELENSNNGQKSSDSGEFVTSSTEVIEFASKEAMDSILVAFPLVILLPMILHVVFILTRFD